MSEPWTELTVAAPGETCPACNRRVPIPKEDTTPRKRAQFNVAVPKDAAEDGVEILKTLVEETRKHIGRPEGTPPYFVIVEGLHALLTGGV